MELLREREKTGITLERLAEYAAISPEDLEEWERTGVVPRKHVAQVKWGLWAARRDAALEESGLPECEWQNHLAAQQEEPDMAEVAEHMEECEVCLARSNYVEDHVGPMPPMGGGLMMQIMARIGGLKGWQQTAASGALLLLMMAGIGVVILLVLGLINLDLGYVVQALALFVLLAVSGAAGGIVFHATAPIRRHSKVGHYASAILTVYGYLASVGAMVALAALFVGWDTIGPELGNWFAEPSDWVIWLSLGAIFGLVFGRGIKE